MQVTAIVVRRRSMGKNLAFAVVKVINDGPCQDKLNDQVIQVAFRRHSPAWDQTYDDTFPTKCSCLPYGATVKLDLRRDVDNVESHSTSSTGPKFEVRSWTVLVDPREKALSQAKQAVQTEAGGKKSNDDDDGVSCSKYFASRMNDYLMCNGRTNFPLKPRSEKPSVLDEASTVPDDPSSHGDKDQKSLRAKIFASFLVDTFGFDLFRRQGGVLDVAGGKGKLSVELAVMAQAKCTVVDPLIRGKGGKQRLSPREIKRIQRADGPLPSHMAKYFLPNDECRKLVQESSCVVGLHPDECTEDLLDAALALDKPVAIVPCCVYACLRPDRRLANGTPVRTYDEFIDYLMQKDGRIRKTKLPFKGRNQALTVVPARSLS